MIGVNVAHRNRSLDGWAETARSDLANSIALLVLNLDPRTGWGAALRQDADQFARRAMFQLCHDACRTWKAAFFAAAFLNGPAQTGFNGGCVRGYVIAVKAQSRFETQTVAGPKPGWGAVWMIQHQPSNPFCLSLRD